MTVCKHCGKRIIYLDRYAGWLHVRDSGAYAKSCESPWAEPLEEWITPTEGPELLEVEVRDGDNMTWKQAELICIHEQKEFKYIVKRDGFVIDCFKQCRMRKEKTDEM
jgi:hypothetical protein